MRAGTYREQVRLEGVSGVRIMGYDNEVPAWEGVVDIQPSSWDYDPPSGICSTQLQEDIFALFLDDDLLTAARWPNALWSDKTVFNSSYWRPTLEGSDRGTVVDEALAESGLDMTGAMAILNIGSWQTYVAEVISHGKGNNKFSYNDTFGEIDFKVDHNQYYLEGSLALLDAPEEWHYDQASQTLRVIPPEGRGCSQMTSLKGRTIDYGLTIAEGSKNITVANFNFFAANMNVTAASDITLDSINFLFPSSSHRMLQSAGLAPATRMVVKERGKVINCTFHGGEGPALIIEGEQGVFLNNLFSYNDWVAQGNVGTLLSKCHDCSFVQNTLYYNGAAHGLRTSGRHDFVALNHFEGQCAGMIQNDGASIQVSPTAQNGFVAQNNWVHDSPKKGIRFDGDGVGKECGRNGTLAWNVGWSVRDNWELAPKGDNHTIVSNTAFDSDLKCSLCVVPSLHGEPMNENTVVRLNAATVMAGGGGLLETNYEGMDLTTFLVDVHNFDFRPMENSPLVLEEGGYIGAYDPHEETYWIPGHRTPATSRPIPKDGGTLARGRAAVDAVICLPGYQATSHHFYLGTDRYLACLSKTCNLSHPRDAVAAAGPDSPQFQYSTQGTVNIFPLEVVGPPLEEGEQYFWRVDAWREQGVVKGDVWTFYI